MSPKLETKSKPKPTVLILMPEHQEDCEMLERTLSWDQYDTVRADREMAERLIMHNQIDVVLCEVCLPGGDWKDVLRIIQDHQNSSRLIVCGKHADMRLWAEVISMGGFDVLAKPFEPEEVERVVQIASTPYIPLENKRY